MKLKSIYEHMEKATKNIPENANVKIIFRHFYSGENRKWYWERCKTYRRRN